MDTMDRREFIGKTAAVVGAAFASSPALAKTTTRPAASASTRPAGKILRAGDTVTLGKTGIKVSRLAMGTGTFGGKEQRDLGVEGLVKLFRAGLDRGIRWWDCADMYKSHPHVKAALKEVKRDKVTITSKTMSRDADGVRGDIERFRKEMDTDYIDVVLLHCMTDADWREKMKGSMDVLSEAKQKGWVRAVGCSCHTLAALKAAADEPWVEVDLARLNPYAEKMDVNKPEDVPQVVKVLETMHERGKAIYCMKIVGEGVFKGEQIDNSLRFVLEKPYVSGFTIGFSNERHLDEIIERIDRIQVRGA